MAEVDAAPTAAARARPVRAGAPLSAARSTASPRRWAQLRREVDPAYTWPKAQARVNRAMGVSRRADAGEAQLDDGPAFLRSELAKLARDYPDAAERLRIPGSVEGIDRRLGVATGEPRP